MKNDKPTWFTWPRVLLASAVVPPVGLVMSWMRPWPSAWGPRSRVLAGRIAFSGILVILTVAYGVALGVLRVEMSGAGWKPFISLHDPSKDQDSLEKNRAEQRLATAVVAAAEGAPVVEEKEKPNSESEPAAANP